MNARTYFDEPFEDPPIGLVVDILGDVENNSVEISVDEVVEPEELHGFRRLPEPLTDYDAYPRQGYEPPEFARFRGVFSNWERVSRAIDAFVAQYRCRHRVHPLVR